MAESTLPTSGRPKRAKRAPWVDPIFTTLADIVK